MNKSVNYGLPFEPELFPFGVSLNDSRADQLQYLEHKMSQAIEENVFLQMHIKEQSQVNTVDDYFKRIGVYEPIHTYNGYSTHVCSEIAKSAIDNPAPDTVDEFFYFNIDQIIKIHEKEILEASNEILEFRYLQNTRKYLLSDEPSKSNFIGDLKKMFHKSVIEESKQLCDDTTSDIEAELLLFLSDSKRANWLETEYYTRLDSYKSDVATTSVADVVFSYYHRPLWQCFTRDRLELTCSVIVELCFKPDDVAFDLSLNADWLHTHHITTQVAQRCADWLVLEWMKDRFLDLTGNSTNDSRDKESNGINNKITLFSFFESASRYKNVINLLIEKGFCQPGTDVWIDRRSGYKTLIVNLIQHLSYQKYFKDNVLPSGREIQELSHSTFGVELSLDCIKTAKSKYYKQTFDFIKPATTQN